MKLEPHSAARRSHCFKIFESLRRCITTVSYTHLSGDARTADRLFAEPFDHILLMGPMYHLLEASERAKAVWAALKPVSYTHLRENSHPAMGLFLYLVA